MRIADIARIRLVLSRSAHFGRLPPGVRDRLIGIARLYHARHGERLGTLEHQNQLFIVLCGAVRFSTHPIAGNGECVHAVMGVGSFFGLANAVRHGPYRYEAQAFGATDLAVVDGKRLVAALDQHPRLWRRVSALLARRLKLAIDLLADNRALALEERLVRRLLSHATSMQRADGEQPTVLMTQGDLARMLQAARSKVNLVLKELEGQGLLRTGYRTITLLDLPALRSLAGREVEPL